MTLLIIGLALWWAAHLLKRLAPDLRANMTAKMGEASKGAFALAIVVSVVLMTIGYRAADFTVIWQPPGFLTHINNLLMVLSIYVFGASGAKDAKVWIGTKIRHPQLTAVKIWAFAHLLVNGDLASIILFGGILAWAVVSVIVINKADGPWTPPPQAPAKKEVTLIIVTLVLTAIIAYVHIWLGVRPFGG